jgi:DNA-binding beta-propeller fold protein YncE
MNSHRKQIKKWKDFSNVLGHIVLHQEHFGVLDNGNSCVLLFNIESGERMTTIGSYGNGPGEFYSLTGAAFNRQGELYVSDALLGRIQVFDTSGMYVRLFSGSIESPYGLAFTAEDNLVACDGQNHQVRIFSPHETLLRTLGSFGSEPSEFNGPRDVCVSRDGKIIVADSKNSRVQIFDGTGMFLGSIGPFQYPTALAAGVGGEIAVVDFHHTSSDVHIFSCMGELLFKIQCPKTLKFRPRGVAIDKEGCLMVAYHDKVDLHRIV